MSSENTNGSDVYHNPPWEAFGGGLDSPHTHITIPVCVGPGSYELARYAVEYLTTHTMYLISARACGVTDEVAGAVWEEFAWVRSYAEQSRWALAEIATRTFMNTDTAILPHLEPAEPCGKYRIPHLPHGPAWCPTCAATLRTLDGNQ